MLPQPSGTLALTRRVLRALRVLNLVYGFALLALLVATLVAPDQVFNALGISPAKLTSTISRGARFIMLVGLAAVPAVHLVLIRLLAMVQTVVAGDPFIDDNSRRLTVIAWSVLYLELLRIAVAAIAARVSAEDGARGLDVGWSFSFAPWLAVLLLFVLARVFEHGARMRTDLEGTV
ncbi:MAG TPA: DUF2975 domain-containing protein [Gemmatimonadaceae bacterium]|nr:DUF2975 domain-containing protein [Gemmatimonadaceae bacterium]